MGPTLWVEYRGQSYRVTRRPELAIAGYVPWCLEVDGAWYQLTDDAAEATDEARRFFEYSMRSSRTNRTPVFLASLRHPLLVSIDGVAVRGYPMQTDPNRWPSWIFEATGRPATECTTISAEQTLADVVDAAKLWLRTSA